MKESLVGFVGKLFVVKEVSYFEWFDHFDLMHFRPFSEPSGGFFGNLLADVDVIGIEQDSHNSRELFQMFIKFQT